jgi:hypothetical protein
MIPNCGECPLFKYECTDGYGWCDVREREAHCGDQCNVSYNELTNKGAVKILHYAQKWRRGKKMPMLPPYILGIGIDKAINVLRQTK